MKHQIVMALLAAAAEPGPREAPPAGRLQETVAQYNARFPAPAPLEISAAKPADAFLPDSGAIPAWVDSLGMSAAELRAIGAVVGVYAARPSVALPEARRTTVAGVLGTVALAVLAADTERRFRNRGVSNTLSGQRVPFVARPPFADLPPGPAKDLVPGQLIAFDTCGGAFFAALTRLNQAQPWAPFTAFIRSVGSTAFSGPVRADPTCGMTAGGQQGD
ncbi:hypothetical protein ACFOON_04230 [Novosphingobium piscinae]|uniref:Uncharacterized protein n=1 Tax=Novosphingobium piscinae TaxID=1507448 RepID=A0A7X1KRL8_9SPHN|nr:hypothetical protein [Novosphingobium piscinae]MBC2670887.1 hypothetical protein [Novosphingobium piscinae]